MSGGLRARCRPFFDADLHSGLMCTLKLRTLRGRAILQQRYLFWTLVGGICAGTDNFEALMAFIESLIEEHFLRLLDTMQRSIVTDMFAQAQHCFQCSRKLVYI